MKTKIAHTTEVKFYRKNHIIHNANGMGLGTVVFTGKAQRVINGADSPSINAAKRESRRLQEIHGHGCLKVVS